jgi:plastin-1
MEPASKYKRIENCNYAVEISKNDLKFSLVGVGGVDVVNKNTKLVLALVWQMLRKYTLNMLQKLALSQGISSMSEERIVEWANQKVSSSGSDKRMKSFKDPSLKTGLFFLDLIAAMEPRAINPEIITPGSNPDECTLNAKYAISAARKIGACVFLSPADITEGKVKMLFTFCASLWMNELLQVSALANG